MTTRRSISLLLSPVGLLLISAGRLIIVANFNTTTAVTIASSGGFVNTLLGSVIPLVPLFIPYLALLLLLFRRFLLSVMAFAFAAFISPTAITLPELAHLLRADWNLLYSQVHGDGLLAIGAGVVVFLAVWGYNQSFSEGISAAAAMVVALSLLVAIPLVSLSTPLRLANDTEHRVDMWLTGPDGIPLFQILIAALVSAVLLTILGVVLALYSGADLGPTLSSFSWLVTCVVAFVAAVALFPYVNNVYPVPPKHGYYAQATHTMWLPTERLTLSTKNVYYGYVLASDVSWFTVLLAESRTIVYIPADEVVSRSVCQPKMLDQPKQHPPLIPWLYHPPPKLPVCPPVDRAAVSG